MREIKFRGKTIGGEWVTGNYTHLKEDYSTVRKGHYISNKAGAPFAFMVRPESVGQFTGLKDRNGKEVYEGDILKHIRKYNSRHISKCQVVFRKGGFSLDYGNLIYNSIDIIDRTDYQFEIIGNIHESPELLNQLKEEK